MNGWLETIGVVLVAFMGIVLGEVFSKLRKPYWLIGYLLPLVLIVMLVIARHSVTLGFVPPFCWIAAGRIKFVVMALVIAMGLTTPLSRITHQYVKLLVCLVMCVFVALFSIMPFLVPLLIEDDLTNIQTKVDSEGICIQTSDFTCGPAAAVTALRKLGLQAQEGEIAVLSHTSPVVGTLPWCLCWALQERYGADGLVCQYRSFENIAQLEDAGITLVVVKVALLTDHCVAVLGVSDGMVLFADPVLGKQMMSCQQFEQIWRSSGIVLKRDSVKSI